MRLKQSVKSNLALKGVYRNCSNFNSEFRLCNQCGCILEYRYNNKGFLCLSCVNSHCEKFKRFVAISKSEFIALTELGFVLRRRCHA